jgi:hypothetical protein
MMIKQHSTILKKFYITTVRGMLICFQPWLTPSSSLFFVAIRLLLPVSDFGLPQSIGFCPLISVSIGPFVQFTISTYDDTIDGRT